MAKLVLIVLTCLSFTVCGQLVHDINYAGMQNKSILEYEFHGNETFWYRSQGRIGKRESTGTYQISGDTVILNSRITDTLEWKLIMLTGKKFLVYPDSCIADLETGFDYCCRYFQLDGESILLLPSNRRFKPGRRQKQNPQ